VRPRNPVQRGEKMETVIVYLLIVIGLIAWLADKHLIVLKWIGAIVGIIVLWIFGQAILDAIIPPIGQYAILFLIAVYFVVHQAVRDARQ
jgi:CHASE2 domain-containing sensor protein